MKKIKGNHVGDGSTRFTADELVNCVDLTLGSSRSYT